MSIIFNSLPVIPLRITSQFGARNTGIDGATTNHPGIDLGADKSKPETAILAVKSGTVSQNYWNNTRGWVIVLQHDGFVTLYQHLKTQSPLKVGSRISSGQIIGTMGNSSKTLTIAVHLHFELRVSGLPVDPEPYLLTVEDEMTEIEVRKIVKKMLAESADKPSSWADAWGVAKDDGVTDGTSPQAVCTREQCAQFIYRALGKVARLPKK